MSTDLEQSPRHIDLASAKAFLALTRSHERTDPNERIFNGTPMEALGPWLRHRGLLDGEFARFGLCAFRQGVLFRTTEDGQTSARNRYAVAEAKKVAATADMEKAQHSMARGERAIAELRNEVGRCPKQRHRRQKRRRKKFSSFALVHVLLPGSVGEEGVHDDTSSPRRSQVALPVTRLLKSLSSLVQEQPKQ